MKKKKNVKHCLWLSFFRWGGGDGVGVGLAWGVDEEEEDEEGFLRWVGGGCEFMLMVGGGGG